MRIVVIDGERLSGKLLHFVLTDAGHDVIVTKGATEAFQEIIGRETDAVLMEADLPDLSGFEVCKELRGRRYHGPILFVTNRRETSDKLRAFDHGADDFVVKPFDPLELVARVHTVARRYRQADQQAMGTILRVGDAELNIGELAFRIDGQPAVVLTPTEMRMLECLMRNSNITISRDTLIERTWGYDFIGDSNRVDVYIRRVRRKVERDVAQPTYIHTVRGLGYVFRPPTLPLTKRFDGLRPVVEVDPAETPPRQAPVAILAQRVTA